MTIRRRQSDGGPRRDGIFSVIGSFLRGSTHPTGLGEAVLNGHGYTAHACSDVPANWVARLVADPEFSLSEAAIVKDGDTTLVVRAEWPLEGGSVAVAYKCVRRITRLKRLTQVCGSNRTWRTYRAGERLRELDIPTARPLLILLPDRFRPELATWIANEWLEGTVNLGETVRAIGRTIEEGQLDELASQLGDMLGRLHRAGGTHRDLKPENVMARLAGGDQPAGVWLIDLDGLSFRPWLSGGRRRRDLSRLVVGIEEAGGVRWSVRLRFLLAYLRGLRDAGDWKDRWSGLRGATEKRSKERARRL